MSPGENVCADTFVSDFQGAAVLVPALLSLPVEKLT